MINIFTDFTAQINANLEAYIGTTTSNVMNAITPVVNTLVLIYIAFWSWSMMRGLISEPITDAASRMIRLSIIVALATKVGLYNQYISDWLWQTPDALANFVVSGNNQSSISFLDTLVTKYDTQATLYWDKGNESTIPNFGFLIMAILIWSFGFLLTGYAAYLLILAKMALAVLLGVGAIFIILVIFDSTRKFFDSWIGQVVNFIFLNMLTVASMSMTMSIVDRYISAMSNDVDIVSVFPLIALSGMSVLVLMQMPSIASALGGGVAISTLNSDRWLGNKASNLTGNIAKTTGKAAGKAIGYGYRVGVDKYKNSKRNSISKSGE